MPRVNPDILVWARETAGLTVDQAVEKLGINDARGVPAAERLAALEAGADAPTRAMLARMAKHYRRPLLTFYLAAPPRKGDRGQDFRSLPLEQRQATEPLLDALLRDIKARQAMVRAVLEDEEETAPLPYIGSANMAEGVERVLASIRTTIGVSIADYRAQRNIDDAFAMLRAGAEAAGVFVLLIGNLGSHHTAFELETFRGFALADPIAPFVVINDQDAKAAWSFTLLHELAHLWLGTTGVSGFFADLEIERFCNDVAGEFLLPTSELGQLHIDRAEHPGATADRISGFARERHLSRSMVAYKLYRTHNISNAMWQQLRATFREEWLRERAARRQRERAAEGGPSYYVVRRHRLGPALLNLVSRTLSAGTLTPTKAGKVLGVKPRNVQPLLGAVPNIRRPAE